MQTTVPLPRSRAWLTGTQRRWSSLGIRAKLLISLTLLMALSMAGSIIAFVVMTNTTRAQLQEQQLVSDLGRAEQALRSREHDLRQAVQLLANDPQLQLAMQRDQASILQQGDRMVVLDIDRRALTIRERFQLDQVLVVGPNGDVRANIVTQSTLSARSFELAALSPLPERDSLRLLGADPTLLVAYSAVPSGGSVIATLALSDELARMRQNLDLTSHIELALGHRLLASSNNRVAAAANPSASQATMLTLGPQQVQLMARLENPAVDSIIGAGRNAMMLSVLTTFIVLLLLGGRFAHTVSGPIRRLTHVADAIAAGDWNKRAALAFNDEIGRLGHAFDHAAQTITSLLGQRDQEASQRQAILESISDGVLAIDAQERLLLANPTARQLLGWAEAPLHLPLRTALAHEDRQDGISRQRLVELMLAVLHEDAVRPEQQVLLAGRDVRISCALVKSASHQPIGVVAVLQDISEAVAADRAKTQFIATASHELRTPLASIKGWLDLIHLQGIANLNEEQICALGVIRRQSDLLVTLVNDLLEVARLEQGQSAVERSLVEPATTARALLVGMEAQISAEGHELVVEIPPRLPELLVNSSHLRRILANMVTNAIKYTPSGGRIVVRGLVVGERVRLEVEDNGVGIAAQDQERIFMRFFRSENPLSVKAGGSGLGLAIARSMAELHGGSMGFTSSEGQGSCFWVEFPPVVAAMREVGEQLSVER